MQSPACNCIYAYYRLQLATVQGVASSDLRSRCLAACITKWTSAFIGLLNNAMQCCMLTWCFLFSFVQVPHLFRSQKTKLHSMFALESKSSTTSLPSGVKVPHMQPKVLESKNSCCQNRRHKTEFSATTLSILHTGPQNLCQSSYMPSINNVLLRYRYE